MTCHECGGQGHIARQCPSRANKGGVSCFTCGGPHYQRDCPSGGAAVGGGQQRLVKCYNCGQMGNHISRDCPEPRQAPACYNCGSTDGHLARDCPSAE